MTAAAGEADPRESRRWRKAERGESLSSHGTLGNMARRPTPWKSAEYGLSQMPPCRSSARPAVARLEIL